MKLLFKAPFADYFHQKILNTENRGLIGRMQGLEVKLFIARHDVSLSVLAVLLDIANSIARVIVFTLVEQESD